jgi:hypothetical protein
MINKVLAIFDPVGVSSFGRLGWQTSLGDMSGDCRIEWYSIARNHVFF